MREILRLLVVLALAALAAFTFRSLVQTHPSRPAPTAGSAETNGAAEPQPTAPVKKLSTVPPRPTPAPTTPPFAPPDEAAMLEIDKVRLMIRDYRTIAGENPVGTNAEIMAAVMGGNPRQATLGPPDGMALNANGELIDRWGTPYFFHQLSKAQMEIRSAGPDKILWTEDDPIIK